MVAVRSRPQYVEVAPAIPLSPRASQTFTYRVADGQRIEQYEQVHVPVGKRIVSGVVMGVRKRQPAYSTKEIQKPIGVGLTKHQIEFAQWIAKVMHGGLGFTLRLFVPPGKPRIEEEEAPQILLKDSKNWIDTMHRLRDVHAAAMIEKDTDRRLQDICDIASSYASLGKQVLILLPELWMTESYVKHLRTLGVYSVVAVVHGGISQKEKVRAWYGVAAGTLKIIVGTQKALFLPFKTLGLIVLDEEQYDTHKLWDQYPRLHNRYGIQQLARIHNVKIVYASSFPSVFLQYGINTGRITTLRDNPVPLRMSIIGSSFEDRRQRRPVPNEFITTLHGWLKKKERILIVHNQRQSFVEKVLKELHLLRKKQLVFGTTAVFSRVKGREFDRVVWLFPERSLRYPDYRSYERSMVMLTRLKQHIRKTRAVTLVTRYPQYVKEHLGVESKEFYRRQLQERERYFYPPCSDLVRLSVRGRKEKSAFQKAGEVRREIDKKNREMRNIKETQEHVPAQRRKILIRGPYRGFGWQQGGRAELHITLRGPLEQLLELYKGLDVDSVDLAPHRVL